MLGQKGDDGVGGGAQDLADGDLFGAPVGGEGGQAEEAEGGDEDGEEGNDGQDVLEVGFVLVEAVYVVLQDGVGEWLVGDVLLPLCLEVDDGLGDMVGGDANGEVFVVWEVDVEGQGVDGLV